MNVPTMNVKKITALFILWIITMIPSIYFATMQYQEGLIVDEYISSNKLQNLSVNKQTAILVSDLVRKDFKTDKYNFVSLKMSKRPFLREDVGYLLTHKEGLCGEGTRVIADLLNRLGFDATRVTLYNKELQSSHTLVSVMDNGREFFVDSINSTESVNALLRKQDISANDFNVLHYTDDIGKRAEFDKAKHKSPTKDSLSFFKNYWLYSYEAIPFSKILTKVGIDVRVFHFDRPNKLVSMLAERPKTIMSLVMFILSLCIIFILSRFRFIKELS